MPIVLAWFSKSNLIHCHYPHLPAGEIDVARLDSIYRIVKTTPGLFLQNEIEGSKVIGSKLEVEVKALRAVCLLLFGLVVYLLLSEKPRSGP